MARSPSQRRPASSPAASDLDSELARITVMSVSQLKDAWRRKRGGDLPTALSKDLIARALAHWLQEERLGGLAPHVQKLVISLTKKNGAPVRHLKISVDQTGKDHSSQKAELKSRFRPVLAPVEVRRRQVRGIERYFLAPDWVQRLQFLFVESSVEIANAVGQAGVMPGNAMGDNLRDQARSGIRPSELTNLARASCGMVNGVATKKTLLKTRRIFPEIV